jgi:hypothetical protein
MTEYTPELADQICGGLAEGKSLVKVCKELDVQYRDVFAWLRDPAKKDFADNYASAREAQAHLFAEEVIAISDDSGLQSDDKRVRIDARKWYAGKMQPKKYGDKVSTEISGPEGGPIVLQAKEQRDAAVAAALLADS